MLLLPGVALLRRWPVRGVLLLIVGVVAPLFAAILLFQFRNHPVDLLSQSNVLRGLVLVAIGIVASRLMAVWVTADRTPSPDSQRRMRLWGTIGVCLLAIPIGFAGVRIEQVRGVVGDVFATSPTAGAVNASTDTLADQFQTVLLLGGDEAADRFGLRTDTMILALVNKQTGRTAVVSIPRNLQKLTFPPTSPMGLKYPNGFDDLTNAVFISVGNDDALSAAYSSPGLEPGVRALMEGLSYSMNITIDDYALVNMCGFVQLVDAIDGVTIDLPDQLPMPGKTPCSYYTLPATIGPGPTYMDGTKALGYVRSRAADSDYQRMERQRILLQAILSEIGIGDVLANFGGLADALRSNVRTSMTLDEAQSLASLLQTGAATMTSVGLVPPLVEPADPDFAAISDLLQQTRQSLIGQN